MVDSDTNLIESCGIFPLLKLMHDRRQQPLFVANKNTRESRALRELKAKMTKGARVNFTASSPRGT
jgi:hypothetical protein